MMNLTFTIILNVFMSFIVYLYHKQCFLCPWLLKRCSFVDCQCSYAKEKICNARGLSYTNIIKYFLQLYFHLIYFIYNNKSSQSVTHLLNVILRMLLFSLCCDRLSRPSKYNNHLPTKPIKRTEWLFRNKKGHNRVRPWAFFRDWFPSIPLYISMTSTFSDTLVWVSCIADLALWLLVHWNIGLRKLYKPSDVNHLLELLWTLQVVASWFEPCKPSVLLSQTAESLT